MMLMKDACLRCDFEFEIEMGCGSSNDSGRVSPDISVDFRHNQTLKNIKTESVIEAYKRLDEEICILERGCPGPRLATSEAWIEYLQSKLATMETDRIEAPVNGEPVNEFNLDDLTLNSKIIADEQSSELVKVSRLAVQLDVAFNKDKAAQQEEFLATISRTSLLLIKKHFYLELINHATARTKNLLATYNKLSEIYVEQDGLIASVNGGIYVTNLEEEVDSQLETAREIRDKLGSVLEQWRTCGYLLRASARSALEAGQIWESVHNTRIDRERIATTLECRQAIQASLTAFEAAHLSLPQVDIKFVTKRQSLAVDHANVYLLTDIADPLRYTHTKKVLDAYKENISKASNWLLDTFEATLKKDFVSAEENVTELAKKLRQERLKIISREAGPKLYINQNKIIDAG